MATRPRKPCDKATVETIVTLAYRRIYGKLRNLQCNDIHELNGAIRCELEALKRRHFKGRD